MGELFPEEDFRKLFGGDAFTAEYKKDLPATEPFPPENQAEPLFTRFYGPLGAELSPQSDAEVCPYQQMELDAFLKKEIPELFDIGREPSAEQNLPSEEEKLRQALGTGIGETGEKIAIASWQQREQDCDTLQNLLDQYEIVADARTDSPGEIMEEFYARIGTFEKDQPELANKLRDAEPQIFYLLQSIGALPKEEQPVQGIKVEADGVEYTVNNDTWYDLPKEVKKAYAIDVEQSETEVLAGYRADQDEFEVTDPVRHMEGLSDVVSLNQDVLKNDLEAYGLPADYITGDMSPEAVEKALAIVDEMDDWDPNAVYRILKEDYYQVINAKAEVVNIKPLAEYVIENNLAEQKAKREKKARLEAEIASLRENNDFEAESSRNVPSADTLYHLMCDDDIVISNRYGGVFELMAQEERENVTYLMNTVGTEKAREYMNALQEPLETRYTVYMEAEAGASAKRNAEYESVRSVGDNVMNSLYGMVGMAERIFRGKLLSNEIENPNGMQFIYGNLRDTKRTTVAEEVLGGGFIGEIYHIGMAVLDNLARKALGQTGSMILLTSEVLTDTARDVYHRGGTSAQAATCGMLSASVELVTEALDWERYDNMYDLAADLSHGTKAPLDVSPGGIKALYHARVKKELTLSGFKEGSEGLISALSDQYIDWVVMGDKSRYELDVSALKEKYIAGGMSEEAAEQAARKGARQNVIREIVASTVEEAVAGWTMSGVSVAGGRLFGKGTPDTSDRGEPRWLGDHITVAEAMEIEQQSLDILAQTDFSRAQTVQAAQDALSASTAVMERLRGEMEGAQNAEMDARSEIERLARSIASGELDAVSAVGQVAGQNRQIEQARAQQSRLTVELESATAEKERRRKKTGIAIQQAQVASYQKIRGELLKDRRARFRANQETAARQTAYAKRQNVPDAEQLRTLRERMASSKRQLQAVRKELGHLQSAEAVAQQRKTQIVSTFLSGRLPLGDALAQVRIQNERIALLRVGQDTQSSRHSSAQKQFLADQRSTASAAAAGDKALRREAQYNNKRLNGAYERISEGAGLHTEYGRTRVEGFQNMKLIERLKGTPKYAKLKTEQNRAWLQRGYDAAVEKGDISALTGFDHYMSVAENVERELIGVIASQDVKWALLHSTKIVDKMHGGKPGRTYSYKDCKVGVNPAEGIVVQVSPQKKG